MPAKRHPPFRNSLRRIYGVIDVYWVVFRWLILWLFSRAARTVGLPERYTIVLGNALFCGWDYSVECFDSYEKYIVAYPVSLEIYGDADFWLKSVSGKDVLDLGSGLGQYSAELTRYNPKRIVAVECQEAKHRFARDRWRFSTVQFLCGYAEKLPLADESVDFIFSHTVFEHVTDLRAALSECRRVLRPGGSILIGFNHIAHRGGHHLFPYIRFPWPLGIASEGALCGYWSNSLISDQQQGRMGFYSKGGAISSLKEGGEIHLNAVSEPEFLDLIDKAGLRLRYSYPCEQYWELAPAFIRNSRFRPYLRGTIVYGIDKISVV